jgi:hypothetical protein
LLPESGPGALRGEARWHVDPGQNGMIAKYPPTTERHKGNSMRLSAGERELAAALGAIAENAVRHGRAGSSQQGIVEIEEKRAKGIGTATVGKTAASEEGAGC